QSAYPWRASLSPRAALRTRRGRRRGGPAAPAPSRTRRSPTSPPAALSTRRPSTPRGAPAERNVARRRDVTAPAGSGLRGRGLPRALPAGVGGAAALHRLPHLARQRQPGVL